MVGTPDITDDFESKTELDLRNRLIAKFEIVRAKTFWGSGFDPIPKRALYPSGDRVHEICKQLTIEVESASADVFGQLLVEWAKFESLVLGPARQFTEKNLSIREAISSLATRGQLTPAMVSQLNQIRRVRNMVAHSIGQVSEGEAQRYLSELKQILPKIERTLTKR